MFVSLFEGNCFYFIFNFIMSNLLNFSTLKFLLNIFLCCKMQNLILSSHHFFTLFSWSRFSSVNILVSQTDILSIVAWLPLLKRLLYYLIYWIEGDSDIYLIVVFCGINFLTFWRLSLSYWQTQILIFIV